MASWSDFLIEKARQYGLSKGEMDLLVTQFNEENINKNQTEPEWAENVGMRLTSYKKFKTGILKKFTKSKTKSEACEFISDGRDKFLELRDWLKTQHRNSLVEKISDASSTNTTVTKPVESKNILACPYRGLFAFRPEDAPVFFGREKFTEALVAAVSQKPLVAVIGNSGIGKSSVVFAGLIPELNKLANWETITFRPNKSPLFQLANALLQWLEPEMDKLGRIGKCKKYAEQFKTQELILKDVLDVSLKESYPQKKLLIVVDQFEEIYTLSPEDEKLIFLKQLLDVVEVESQKNSYNVVVAIALRADFYGLALANLRLGQELQKWKSENILEMNRDELKSAIEKPAEQVGLTIQDGLTKIILDQVQSNPGELPLLQFTLEQLWKRQSNGELRIAAYDEIGGVEQALANHAETIYQKLNEDEKKRGQHIFTQLVRFGERTEDTRRLANYSEIGEENWNLVNKLASADDDLQARLLVTGYDDNQKQRTVEVVHEALIRGWKRLREWMEEDREFRKWQDRLRFEKTTWKNKGKDNSALLRGALLVEAENWLTQKLECVTDQTEIEFIEASRQSQEQEDIERIKDLLNLSQKELQLKQQLISLVIAVKAGVKLRDIKERSEEFKKNVIERLQQGSYEITEQNLFVGHKGKVNGVSFSPDGLTIASVSDDQNIKLWYLDGKLSRNFPDHTNEVLQVSFSPDGQIIASACADRIVRLWTLDGTLLRTLERHTDRVNAVSFSPDGQIIASACADRIVRLWTLDGTLLRTLEEHTAQVYGVSFSPDGQIIASACADRIVRLWTLDGTLLRTLEEHSDWVWGVSFSPDGQIIASACADRIVRLWTLDGTLLRTLERHTDRVYGVSFSPNGQIIASAGADKTVRLWSLDGTLLRTLEGHTDGVYGVSFSPDGQMVASASDDRTVRLWSLNRTLLRSLEGHTDWVNGVSFSPDGQIIASAGADRIVRLWNLNGTLLRTLEEHTDWIWGVSFSPDGQIIASACDDTIVRLWTLDGTLLKTLKGHTDQVWGVSFNPDGQIIASACADRTVRLWTIDGKFLRPLEGHTDQVRGVSFSPDGQIIASACADRIVRLWTLDGTLLRTLERHTDRVYGVSFSPNGQIIASAGADKTVRLWSLDGTLLRTLEGHTDGVYGVSFSPDGQMVASTGADRTVRLWNIDGTLLRSLEGHTDQVYGVTFSPNGQMIASASSDQTVRLWRIDREDLILDLDVKLNNLLKKGCNWIKDYLKTNPNVSESDRHLCDGICIETTE
jgi:WD40 repeat protein